MSRLLIDEAPLQVLPTLATEVGLNAALVAQQLHYRVNRGQDVIAVDGRPWLRRSIATWRSSDLPFWSESTIKRTLAALEERGLIVVRAGVGDKRSRLYAVEYGELERLLLGVGRSDLMNQVRSTADRPNGPGQDDPVPIWGKRGTARGKSARGARTPVENPADRRARERAERNSYTGGAAG